MGCNLLWNTLTYALYSCAINTPFSTLPGKCQFIQVQPSILVLCENEYENSTTIPSTSTPFVTTNVPLTTTVAPTNILASTTMSPTTLPVTTTRTLPVTTTTTSTTFHPTTTAFPSTTPSVTTFEPTTLPMTTTVSPTTIVAETTLSSTTLPTTTTTVSTTEASTTLPPTTTAFETTTTTVKSATPAVKTTTVKPTPMPTTTTSAPTMSGMIVKKEYVVKERVEKKDDTTLVLSIVFGSILFLVLLSLSIWKRKELISMCRDKCKCCKKENSPKQAEVRVEMTEREEIEKNLQKNRKTMINVQKALRRSKMKINSVGVSQHPTAPFSKSVEKPPIPKRSLKKGAIKGKNVRQAVAALERQKK